MKSQNVDFVSFYKRFTTNFNNAVYNCYPGKVFFMQILAWDVSDLEFLSWKRFHRADFGMSGTCDLKCNSMKLLTCTKTWFHLWNCSGSDNFV